MQNERQWREQKRSWIFFRDKIAEEQNIISDSVDGNVFMLDCESARLSIWSEKWKTFIDVGVSSLLKEESIARKTGETVSSAEIRIFYKGMELEKRSVQRDAGIIEFIDIKRDLERAYINISRGGFTRKGSRFFEEEMYPGLLEAVRKVLKYLAKTVIYDNISEKSEEKTENFSDKIVRIVNEKCDELLEQRRISGKKTNIQAARLRDEIISLTVSVSVLAYYSTRDEWNITETMDKPEFYRENAWLVLVSKIDKILKESRDESILSELAEMTKFFDIKVYNENHRRMANDVHDSRLKFKFRFTQIFLEENHWAVLQVRKDAFSRWNAYLILLGGNQKEENLEFQRVTSFPHTPADCEKLQKWGEDLCNAVDLVDDEGDSSQQFLMNWILKNIPTVAMFCNKDGNVRINILSRRIYPSIFLNDNFKYLILERMMEKAETDGIQRFSTITWQRNENFGCGQLPFNIYFVKRGYFAFGSCHKSIIPFEGDLLKKWKKIIEKPSEVEKKIIALIEFVDIQHYFQPENMEEGDKILNMLYKQVMGFSATIAEMILIRIEEDEFKSKSDSLSLEELLTEIDNIEANVRQDLCNNLVQYGIASSSDNTPEDEVMTLEKKIRENVAFDILCSTWIYLTHKADHVFDVMNQVMREYQQYTDIKINPLYQQKRDRIADYLLDRVPYKFNKEQILQYMNTYEEELLTLFHNMECRRVRQKMNKLFISNRYLVSRLNQKN